MKHSPCTATVDTEVEQGRPLTMLNLPTWRDTPPAILGAIIALCSFVCAAVTAPSVAQAACARADGGLGVDRIIEIDTTAGPLFGNISKLQKEVDLLEDKQVVLTFDDGPVPWVTGPILDTLDDFCTKATFFSVGRMALAYPKAVRDILHRGHTIGGHTWSHPLNIRRMKPEKAIAQIEKGFAAISVAAGGAVSPFFRFPGLSDSNVLLRHLQQRGIATFTVDVVSDDSFISNADRLAALTLKRIYARGKGIVLFHDIKRVTAKALPIILKALLARGYKVVHLRAKRTLTPLPDLLAEAQAAFDKKWKKSRLTAAGDDISSAKPDTSIDASAPNAPNKTPNRERSKADTQVTATAQPRVPNADKTESNQTGAAVPAERVLRFIAPPANAGAPVHFVRPFPRQRGSGPPIAAPLPIRKPQPGQISKQTGPAAKTEAGSKAAPTPAPGAALKPVLGAAPQSNMIDASARSVSTVTGTQSKPANVETAAPGPAPTAGSSPDPAQ